MNTKTAKRSLTTNSLFTADYADSITRLIALDTKNVTHLHDKNDCCNVKAIN